MRSRLAVAVLILFVALAPIAGIFFGWYGFRVVTELRPGSWRTPTRVVDRNGDLLVALYGPEWRVTDPVILEKLPEHVPNAFLAAEDVRFRRHVGIDLRGIGRAAVRNVRSGGITEGGSTITQQLAKMRFLSSDRTFTRKALEAILAIFIEARLSKEEILEAYLNDVYLGHRGGRAILGIDEASRVYFRKAPEKLTVAEAATLAGMIRSPNNKSAQQRRDAILGVMRHRKWITEDEHHAAVRQRVRFRAGTLQPTPHPYLVSALRHEVIDRIGMRRLRAGGLTIRTAVDRRMQKAAEDAVRGGTQRLRGRYSWLRRREPLQAAILSVDPNTGGIRALVGGSDFRKSQFDRTRRMRRQPGSALKPFTYAAAIAAREITPASIVEDEPVAIQLARNDIWRPQNYDERFRGRVTVREAFEKSLNAPAVRIADEVGVRQVHEVLDDAGIKGQLSDTPAIALGVDVVSMRELVAAYSIFPNLGFRTDPHLIQEIEKGERTIYRYKVRPKEIVDREVAYIVHSLMRGVVQRGTASDLQHLGLGHVAGKTGTTNDYRDAWFIGYAPDLLTAAWIGFDDGRPLRISSAEAALPIWAAFMARAQHKRADLAPPDGVRIVAIEPASGLQWRPGCGMRFDEAFIAGTEPEEKCQRRIERPPILIDFFEPPVITPEEAKEREIPGWEDVTIVIESSPRKKEEEKTEEEQSDEADFEEMNEKAREEIDRQIEEAKRQLEELRKAVPPPQ